MCHKCSLLALLCSCCALVGIFPFIFYFMCSILFETFPNRNRICPVPRAARPGPIRARGLVREARRDRPAGRECNSGEAVRAAPGSAATSPSAQRKPRESRRRPPHRELPRFEFEAPLRENLLMLSAPRIGAHFPPNRPRSPLPSRQLVAASLLPAAANQPHRYLLQTLATHFFSRCFTRKEQRRIFPPGPFFRGCGKSTFPTPPPAETVPTLRRASAQTRALNPVIASPPGQLPISRD